MCTKICYHELNKVVHQLDVNQKERNHISTFFSVPSFSYISGFQSVQARTHDQDDSPTPSTTKPFPSHTSRSKTKPVFLSHYVDMLDETNCDSTEATLLDKDESDPSPSLTVKSPSNSLGTKKTLSRVHFKFPKDYKKLIIEEHKEIQSDSFHPTLHHW